jgi:hypothetical protein
MRRVIPLWTQVPPLHNRYTLGDGNSSMPPFFPRHIFLLLRAVMTWAANENMNTNIGAAVSRPVIGDDYMTIRPETNITVATGPVSTHCTTWHRRRQLCTVVR